MIKVLFIHLPRQEVAFGKECRKINSCGSLKRDFYAGFIPNFSGFGDVTWSRKEQHFGGGEKLPECYLFKRKA